MKNEGHFAYFCALLFDRKSPKMIAKEHGLSSKSSEKYLQDLIDIDLIEVRTQGKIIFKKSGRLVWRKGGPWMQKHYCHVTQVQSKKLVEKCVDKEFFLNFGLFSLSPSDRQTFYNEVDQVVEKYKTIAYQQSLGSRILDHQIVCWNFFAIPERRRDQTKKHPEFKLGV